MAGPAPETRTPGGDGATPGERHGRGGGPTLSCAAVLQPLPSQGLLPASALSAAIDATTGRRWDPWPQRVGIAHGTLDPKQARDHPSFYSLACARFTIACARRTYLLSTRSRTVLTPSVSSRACASLLDRPKAVSGASTSSANFIGPDSVSEGGVVSGLSVKASQWWLGVRPARARQGRPLAAGHCSGARSWLWVATRSAARLVPDRGHRRCRP